jgi:predicted LPLAT superfamily acyltransferase
LGRRPGWRDVFRHIFTFSCVVLDRLFILSNRLARFRITVQGLDNIASVVASGRGCILLGSHLGSFEVLRAVARQCPVPVKALMYFANAGAFSRLMEQVDPGLREAVIEIGAPDAMLRVREAIERGEVVGILADRAPELQRSVCVPFLGHDALLPTGPIILAANLVVPVVLFFSIHKGRRRYEVRFESFADRIVLERGKRDTELRNWIWSYADRLAMRCRQDPYNWFNFYDFWDLKPPTAKPDAVAGADPRLAAASPVAGAGAIPAAADR